MSDFIEKYGEVWTALTTRRRDLDKELTETSFRVTKLKIELTQLERMIEGIAPLAEFEAAHNYLQSLSESAKKGVEE